MKFIAENSITAMEASNDNFMSKIEINKNSTRRLIEKIGQLNLDAEALKVLNCLGQNIEFIDTLDYSYIHLGEKLQFSELSRGEQVFLVSYAAKVSRTVIYLQYDMLQLTKTSLRKYYKIFKDCEYINVVYETQQIYDYFDMVMRGEII